MLFIQLAKTHSRWSSLHELKASLIRKFDIESQSQIIQIYIGLNFAIQ